MWSISNKDKEEEVQQPKRTQNIQAEGENLSSERLLYFLFTPSNSIFID